MSTSRRSPSVLLGLTGLRIDGGIAAVSRCIARAFDEEIDAGRIARADRVLLLEDPANASAPPRVGEQLLSRGSQLRFAWQTWRSHRRHRHDCVLFDLVGLARPLLLPVPGYPPKRYAIFTHGLELAAARSGSRSRVLHGAYRVLANSDHTGERLVREFPALADRVRVVRLCVDPDRIDAWSELRRKEPPPREPAALIVARMWSEQRGKGHDALIEAWPEVTRRVPAAQLWVAGGGDDVERLTDKARSAGIGEAIRFLGRVPDDTLADLYERASVFAMPSRQEGFGLTYTEAMWFSLPCIGTTADASGTVIDDGVTGHLVPYGDPPALAAAIAGLLENPDRAKSMGEAGFRRVTERFSYEVFRSRLLEVLELARAR